MEKLKHAIFTKLTIGDWSKDGHGCSDDIYYKVNYAVDDIQNGYKESCRQTGVQFNHNTDYTGLGKKYDNIWTEYNDESIHPEDVKLLKKHNILTDEFISDHYLIENDGFVSGFAPEDAADLIMTFIAYSMPKDFVWVKVEKPDIKAINGWWDENLNHQFGYGLYE